MKQLGDDDPIKRAEAIHALYKCKASPESLVPALIQLFPDKRGCERFPVMDASPWAVTVYGRASSVAAAIGKASVPYLMESLKSDNIDIRYVSAATLGRIADTQGGLEAAEAVPALIRACDDPEAKVREQAVWALASIRARPESVIERLVLMVTQEKDESVRYAIINALGKLDGTGEQATDPLISALRDASPNVRGAAARALGKYGSHAHAALPTLIEALADNESRWKYPYTKKPVYDDIVDALVLLVKANPEAVRVIEHAMRRNSQVQVRVGAALVLIRLSTRRTEALDVLKEALAEERSGADKALQALKELEADGRGAEALVLRFLSDDDRQLRFRAIDTLGAIAGPAGISALIQAISDEDDEVGERAVEAIGDIGASAAPAVPVLCKVVALPKATGNYLLRDNAIEALGKIGAQAKPAVPLLIGVLADDEEFDLRATAATSLGSIAPQDPQVLAALRAELEEPPRQFDDDIYAAIAAALGQSGPVAKPAVPLLTRILSDPDTDDAIRASAASSLGRIGITSEEIVSALSQVLGEEKHFCTEELRREAVCALRTLRAKSALPKLREVLADKDELESVRNAAADAIRLIETESGSGNE